MPIEITARHMEGAAAAKVYAQKRSEKLIEAFPRIEHIHVILDVEKHRHEAQVVVQAKNHIRLEAEETSENMVNSIDVAFDRTEKQLRKQVEKIHDHRIKPGEAAEKQDL